MITLNINDQMPRRLLCLGAHCDDIEIGCGGTILRLARQCPDLVVTWVVFSSTPERAQEALESANLFLEPTKGATITIKEFRDGFFPYVGAEIKECFEQLKSEFSPSLIFTHYRHDLHQDHRMISDLTWNTFRAHLILEYEIPKYDGDLGAPNFFVHLDQAAGKQKCDYLLRCFATQRQKHWFTAETFLSLLRLRGIESAAPGGYAEAFYCRKLFF